MTVLIDMKEHAPQCSGNKGTLAKDFEYTGNAC